MARVLNVFMCRVANALVEKQRVQLVDMHKDGCPWKTGQCDGNYNTLHYVYDSLR